MRDLLKGCGIRAIENHWFRRCQDIWKRPEPRHLPPLETLCPPTGVLGALFEDPIGGVCWRSWGLPGVRLPERMLDIVFSCPFSHLSHYEFYILNNQSKNAPLCPLP